MYILCMFCTISANGGTYSVSPEDNSLSYLCTVG